MKAQHRAALLVGLAMLCLQGCGNASMDSVFEDLELPELGWGNDGGGDRELEVPPDLDPPESKGDFSVVSIRDGAGAASRILPESLKVSLHSEDNVTWLVAGASPDSLWPHLVDFWRSNGFVIADTDKSHGSMEIAWRERAPDASLGMRIRDMFRMRMEREPDAVTNIYLANRRAQLLGGAWRLMPGDQEIEVELLQDLADHLDVAADQLLPLQRVDTELDVRNLRGVPVLSIGQAYSSVWRRLGVTFERAGLEVHRADRSRSVYLIEYSAASEAASMADGGTALPRRVLQVHLLSKNAGTLVTVHENYRRGPALDYETAYDVLQRIVQAYRVRA